MNRSDIESFFKTLILGDFDENPNTAAYIVGGIISLIPIVDQVMDARDVSGALYRINAQGGFDTATSDQLVNLGLLPSAAFPKSAARSRLSSSRCGGNARHRSRLSTAASRPSSGCWA
jgi:hypothetical protein